jgi:hypothetical protein
MVKDTAVLDTKLRSSIAKQMMAGSTVELEGSAMTVVACPDSGVLSRSNPSGGGSS